jgi:hypothetical protein
MDFMFGGDDSDSEDEMEQFMSKPGRGVAPKT